MDSKSDVRKTQGATAQLNFAIFSAVLGMFQFGYNVTVINAPQTVIEAFYNRSFNSRYGEPMPEDVLNLLWPITVAITAIGGMVGALVGAPVSEKIGRKNGMLVNIPLGVISAALMGFSYYADSYEMVIAGRFVVGIHCGLYTGLAPMYVSEISPKNIRGATGTINQLAVTIGLFLGQVLGLSEMLGTEHLWPVLLGLVIVPPILQLVTLPFCPESPRYLLGSKNDKDEAVKALIKLRGTNDVMDEIQKLYDEKEALKSEQEINMCRLCSISSLRLPLGVAIMMHLSQQLTGINCIFYYSTSLFATVGLEPNAAKHASLAVGGIMIIMTLISIPLMDGAGRKVLHLTGLGGMFIFSLLFTVTFYFSAQKGTSSLEMTSIVMALAFVVFFALGPGSIPWMITPELFSHGPRAGAVAVCVLMNWLANFVVGVTFPPMQSALQELVFLPYSGLLLFFFLFLLFLLPETKGKSIEEIAASFAKLSNKHLYTSLSRDELVPEESEEDSQNNAYGTFPEVTPL